MDFWQPDGTGICFNVARSEAGNICGLSIEIDGEEYSEGYTIFEARLLAMWLDERFGAK